jgi:hypothetical protein
MDDSFYKAQAVHGVLSPQSIGPPGLPEVLVDERCHLLEHLLGGRRGEIAQQTFALALKDGQVDLATSLAVLSDELIEVRAWMPLLVAACPAQQTISPVRNGLDRS